MKKTLNVKSMAIIAIMSAIAGVLMFVDIPLSFVAPAFYKMDISDLPCLIGSFSLGPIAGVIIEFLKILIKLLLKPTSSAFVGELSNFLCGVALVLPAGIIYKKKHDKKGALKALVAGSFAMVIFGTALNYFFIIPSYVVMYKMPLEAIISMGQAIFPFIKDKFTFVLCCTLPFNLIKAAVVCVLTFVLYKRISHLINRTNS